MIAMFRSLGVFNYRLWFLGAIVSNTGAWMQRTAQDWIVLTELSDHDAVALGITMALQFGPQLLLMPLTGVMADVFDKRWLLIATQVAQGLLAGALGVLLLLGVAELWHVYGFALALGITTAIDAPARQAFVGEMVADADLPNAVALNSMSFQTARLTGPAIAGVLVAVIGAGPVFILNAISFIAVIASLVFMRKSQLRPAPRLERGDRKLSEGVRYVMRRTDILVGLVMVFLIGTFGFNFPLFISTMTTVEFNQGAEAFGTLSSLMAVGSVVGALLAARRSRIHYSLLVIGSIGFGLAGIAAALAPNPYLFAAALAVVGVSSLTFMTTANSYIQTTTDPQLRGRVMALYMAVFMGGTPLGAPLTGWLANEFGPRWSMALGTGTGLLAGAIAITWLIISRGLRIRRVPDSRWRLRLTTAQERELATQEIAIVETTARRTS